MSAKSVQVSNDAGVTWYQLPGSSADISRESGSVDDSIFGTNFTSNQQTLITWSISTNGYFKGFPGYKAQVKKAGTPTTFTGEATTLEGDVYYITDRTKSLWDYTAGVQVEDKAVPVDAADIEYIDFLQGGVKFVNGYSVTGPVTVSGDYLGTTRICSYQTADLTQSMDTENITDFCKADDNGGFAVFAPQQQTVELSLEGFYADSSEALTDLQNRSVVIVEIDVDGSGGSTARGYFQVSTQSQSGDVGSTETESVTYQLFVPEGVPIPFSWYHTSGSGIPNAVKVLLDAWEDRESVLVRYQAQDSAIVSEGEVWVGDASMSTGVEAITDFTFDLQGSGELTNT